METKNILCPVDFSENSEFALAYASALAKESGGTLHLLYVIEHQPVTDTGFAGYTWEPVDVEAVQKELGQVMSPDAAVAREDHVVSGDPASRIVEFAEDNAIDMVVIGTHGRTGLARLLMGSVAEAVVRRAPCPVITVKQPVPEKQAQ
ncbi:MAG: universal stress protein [Planctomycetales bacterium]|nr:universal stress protein [Planctomycetales bacterium]